MTIEFYGIPNCEQILVAVDKINKVGSLACGRRGGH